MPRNNYIVFFKDEEQDKTIQVQVKTPGVYDAFAQAYHILQARFPDNTFPWIKTARAGAIKSGDDDDMA